ncbi:hypothetical protein KC315_g15800 [Hortaea werneckii]|nr:hypothetical protein KC315_g15800 [Hortaea werneckii]
MAHDDLNPTGPAQPPLDQVYETQGNPITKEPAEQVSAQRHAREAAQQPTDQRIPAQQASYSEATPSSLGRGIRSVKCRNFGHVASRANVIASSRLPQ